MRGEPDDLAVSWANRIALAVVLTLAFVVAGAGRPWWVVALVVAPLWVLVGAGIWYDRRGGS